MVKPTKGRRGPPGSSRGPLFSFGSRFDGWPSFELFAERGQVRARDRNRGLARRASASPFAGAPERRRFITRGHHSSAANLRSNGAPLAMLPREAPIPRQRQRRLRDQQTAVAGRTELIALIVRCQHAIHARYAGKSASRGKADRRPVGTACGKRSPR